MTLLHIHDLAPRGDGIHRAERERVYIERGLPGDLIEAKMQKPSGGIVRAEIVRVIEASPHRVEAPCPHYDLCGGCTLQHVRDDFYTGWKVETVRTALRRQNVEPRQWLEPSFVPGGTRRRATFAAYKKSGRVTLGFHRRRSHAVTDIAHCLIAEPAVMEIHAKLGPALTPILQDGKAVDVFVQTLRGQVDVAITGPIGKKGRPDLDCYEAAAHVAETLGLNRLSWRLGGYDEPEVMVERAPFRVKFGILDVDLPPLAFLQPTEAGERALVATVMDMLPGSGTFADLFSGCGTFAGAVLARGAVDAFESLQPAVRALDKAKRATPLRPFRRDLFRHPLHADELKGYDALVFDPPRAGAEDQARALAVSSVPRLIAVSCNPVTFARDARILAEGGFHLDAVKVVDQFTWSHHVELVGSFSRR